MNMLYVCKYFKNIRVGYVHMSCTQRDGQTNNIDTHGQTDTCMRMKEDIQQTRATVFVVQPGNTGIPKVAANANTALQDMNKGRLTTSHSRDGSVFREVLKGGTLHQKLCRTFQNKQHTEVGDKFTVIYKRTLNCNGTQQRTTKKT